MTGNHFTRALMLLVTSLVAGCPMAVTDRYSLEPADAAALCANETEDGDETDVDCGGADCEGCPLGQDCDTDDDCLSVVCHDGTCERTGCTDGRHNGRESDVDCGGDCTPCGEDKLCLTDSDCASGSCGPDGCGPG
ncbi:MAG: hypothetical protein JW751_10010 [Polyangiaceae bacterium]|nr:hypothetical protein [Polyangiaceae bacterium]